jgi:hypothetical protein
MHGVEVEISPAGDDGHRQHKEVLERRAAERAAFTAVFDGLRAGRYTLWVDGAPRARDVMIEGGTVTETVLAGRVAFGDSTAARLRAEGAGRLNRGGCAACGS